jgi:hypothetical protein
MPVEAISVKQDHNINKELRQYYYEKEVGYEILNCPSKPSCLLLDVT